MLCPGAAHEAHVGDDRDAPVLEQADMRFQRASSLGFTMTCRTAFRRPLSASMCRTCTSREAALSRVTCSRYGEPCSFGHHVANGLELRASR